MRCEKTKQQQQLEQQAIGHEQSPFFANVVMLPGAHEMFRQIASCQQDVDESETMTVAHAREIDTKL